jgi:hypothetical protein
LRTFERNESKEEIMRVNDSIRRQMIACAVCVMSVTASACDESSEAVNPLPTSSMVTASITEVPSQLPVEQPAFINFGCLATSLTYAPRPLTRRFDIVITALTPVDVDSVTIQMLDGTSLGGPMLTFPRPKLTERFGDLRVAAGIPRRFGFEPQFPCGTSMTSVLADIGVRYPGGGMQVLTASQALR